MLLPSVAVPGLCSFLRVPPVVFCGSGHSTPHVQWTSVHGPQPQPAVSHGEGRMSPATPKNQHNDQPILLRPGTSMRVHGAVIGIPVTAPACKSAAAHALPVLLSQDFCGVDCGCLQIC